MSYTNSTPNLHLPQYIATDKPTYLGDWNASMQTIDTVMTATQATANGANSTATAANSTAQAAQQSANTANGKADSNATSIQQIKNDFELIETEFTPAEDFIFAPYCRRNAWMSAVYGSSPLNSSVMKPTHGVVVGSNTRIPLASTVGNIFNLTASTLADNTGKVYIAPGTFNYVSNSENRATYCAIDAYFDGANTVLFAIIPTSTLSAITQIFTFWYSATFFTDFNPSTLSE